MLKMLHNIKTKTTITLTTSKNCNIFEAYKVTKNLCEKHRAWHKYIL